VATFIATSPLDESPYFSALLQQGKGMKTNRRGRFLSKHSPIIL